RNRVIGGGAHQGVSPVGGHIGIVRGQPGIDGCRIPYRTICEGELLNPVVWGEEVILNGDLIAGVHKAQDESILVLGQEHVTGQDTSVKLDTIHSAPPAAEVVNSILSVPPPKTVGVIAGVGIKNACSLREIII